MIKVTRSLIINSNIEEIWQSIADFGGVASFINTIKKCTTEGADGVGQLRHLILDDNSLTTSRLTVLDHERHILTYEIVITALPMNNYTSTMKVEKTGTSSCKVSWCSRFEPSGVLPVSYTHLTLPTNREV